MRNIEKSTKLLYSWRIIVVIIILLVLVSILVGRLIDLMLFDRGFLQKQGNARILRTLKIPAYRGMIVDRNDLPLAVSTPVSAVWVNPKLFNANQQQSTNLAELLDIPASVISQRVQKNKRREFIYLKRQLQPFIADKIVALGIQGLFLQREYRRYYPEGEVTAHLVGFTNVDEQGQEGIELEYNQWLAGHEGEEKVIEDRLGRVITKIDLLQEPTPGKKLKLSIDSRLQYAAYRDLKVTVDKFAAKAGAVVVLNVQTGEVLTMVNQPSYNPNHRPKINDGRYRNRAITDTFEPGSTIKTFALTAALASGEYKPETVIDTAAGRIRVGKNIVKDISHRGELTVTQILEHSSNVGVTKIILSLPHELLPELLAKLGFGEVTHIGFPGERSGYLPVHRNWQPFTLATLSFGYGLSATLLQLAKAYSIIAANGMDYPVSLLKLDKVAKGHRVISADVAKQMQVMLVKVVEQSAKRAAITGYSVAGKTGTSRIVGPQGYQADHHNAVFVGFAPATHPRFIVAVCIHDPTRGGYYSNTVAAPLFAQVMASALRLFNVPPDKLIHST